MPNLQEVGAVEFFEHWARRRRAFSAGQHLYRLEFVHGAFHPAPQLIYPRLMGFHKKTTGALHGLPADLREALFAASKARAAWDDITPLARNEWICWVMSGKKAETRLIRIMKAISKLKGGMRRPCCWEGCPHR